jgi:hypothetical protein
MVTCPPGQVTVLPGGTGHRSHVRFIALEIGWGYCMTETCPRTVMQYPHPLSIIYGIPYVHKTACTTVATIRQYDSLTVRHTPLGHMTVPGIAIRQYHHPISQKIQLKHIGRRLDADWTPIGRRLDADWTPIGQVGDRLYPCVCAVRTARRVTQCSLNAAERVPSEVD